MFTLVLNSSTISSAHALLYAHSSQLLMLGYLNVFWIREKVWFVPEATEQHSSSIEEMC